MFVAIATGHSSTMMSGTSNGGWLIFIHVSCLVLQTCMLSADGVGDDAVLARAVDNALPPSLLPRLQRDGIVLRKLQAKKHLKQNKLGSFFFPLEKKSSSPPRFATEEAILLLRDICFTEVSFRERRIVGAEWWYQTREVKGNIGFHYDKDEAVASNEMKMVYPDVATVTYLTQAGGPTLILNMSTPDGNDNVPVVANTGYASYPVVNRHIMFDGTSMHGVLGELGLEAQPGARQQSRVTLLVNWWSRTPRPPNCQPPTPTELRAFVAASGPQTLPPHEIPQTTNGSWISWMLEQASRFMPVTLAPLSLGASFDRDGGVTAASPVVVQPTHQVLNRSTAQRVRIILPPNERQYVYVPKWHPTIPTYETLNAAVHTSASADAPYTGGFFQMNWTGSLAVGGVFELDLSNHNLVRHIFHSRKPKVFLFVPTEEREDAEQMFLPAIKPFLGKVLPYYAGTKAYNVWGVFGLDFHSRQHSTLRLGIHDTTTDAKFLMKKDISVDVSSVKHFVRSFFKRELQPLATPPPAHTEL
eukprot:m.42128 g.42128  ORF g.42128 m.42128 type:complete len:529 (+) comp15009_c0_seq2:127-1713(+)